MRFVLAFILLSVFANVNATDWIIDCPDYITNDYECPQFKEQFLLKKYPQLISKTGNVLTIATQTGKLIIFKNNREQGEQSKEYSVVGIIEQASIVLVYIQYYESRLYLIIDTKSGAKQEIRGYPIFNQNYTQFVTIDHVLYMESGSNTLSVHKYDGAAWVLEYSAYKPTWSAQWIDDNLLVFTKIEMYETWDPNYRILEVGEKFTLSKQDGVWSIMPFEQISQPTAENLIYLSNLNRLIPRQ